MAMAYDDSMELSDFSIPCGVDKKINKNSCTILNELRRNGELCDAIIIVDGGDHFPVHRAIMSSCSPVFRALFTSGFLESESNQREFYIPNIQSCMMALLIEYSYTREVNLTTDNVQGLLPVADQFQVSGLVSACTDFLRGNLDYCNCLGMRQFANFYFCKDLENEATKFIMKYFTKIYKTSYEFLKLELDELVKILSDDTLNVSEEDDVFLAILRWIKHDSANRRIHILPLLQTVRLGLLHQRYFVETVKNHPYVKRSETCRPLIRQALMNMYNLERETAESQYQFSRPRIPHEVIFVIGGWGSGGPIDTIETYDVRADAWVNFQVLGLKPRAYHGTIAIDEKIYICGGFDGTNYFSSCSCFNALEKSLTEIAPMNSKRCYVSLAVLERCIYALGGSASQGQARLKSAERYTPKTNQWSVISPMHHARSDASATSYGGKVYICGGFNGAECLNTAEYYDPDTNVWTLLPNMRFRRSGLGVISHNNYLYAVGGFNGITRLNQVERYCPRKQSWENITDMESPRSNFALAVVDDILFAIGGFNGVQTIDSVECFNPNMQQWCYCRKMSLERSALSACVVSGLPNVKDFLGTERRCKSHRRYSSSDMAMLANTNPRIMAANAIATAHIRQSQHM